MRCKRNGLRLREGIVFICCVGVLLRRFAKRLNSYGDDSMLL